MAQNSLNIPSRVDGNRAFGRCAGKIIRRICCFLFLLSLSINVSIFAAETPDQAIEKTYGPQIAAVKATPDTKDDASLAENMFNDAKAMDKDPTMQAALLRRALPLTVEDPDSWQLAKLVIEAWVKTGKISEADAWQELVKCGKEAIRRRNLGPDDLLYRASFGWVMQGVWLSLEAGDTASADRQLAAIANDLRSTQLKYQMDLVNQIRERIRFLAPFKSATSAACSRVSGGSSQSQPNADPKLNLVAGETILAQTGNWYEATPYLVRSKDKIWNLILNMHQLRGAPNHSPADTLLPYPIDEFPTYRPERGLDIPAIGQEANPEQAKPKSATGSAVPPTPAAKEKRSLPVMPEGITQEALDNMPEEKYLALKEALEAKFPPKDQDKKEPAAPKDRHLPVMPDNMTQEQVDKMSDAQFASLKHAIEQTLTPQEMRDIQAEAAKPAVTGSRAVTPPANVKASDLVAAAKYLENLAAPTNRPSPVGKVLFYQEAADLLAQAQMADQSDLGTGDKLGLITRQRSLQDLADKASAELLTAFDRSARLSWVDLSAGGVKNTWTSTQGYAHWRELDGGVLESADGTWDHRLTSSRASFTNFVLEFEIYDETADAHPILWLRAHNDGPYYQIEFMPDYTFLAYRAANANKNQEIAKAYAPITLKVWTPIKVVFDGDSKYLWLNRRMLVGTTGKRAPDAGPMCLIGLNGTFRIRKIRIRELK